ncbi:MAG: DUF1015 family protein [Clostridiales Family XIII bacterium]|jgi:uncharacterized protein (DUF1015 family)|nr:DUF1015 family protein [Clostridiales Family XIII bacterium]
MAIFRPFRALRPKNELAERVLALPYDVMNRAEARAMAGENAYSFLRVTRAEIELPDSVDAYDARVYERSRANLDAFIRDGVFLQDAAARFCIYRQTMDGRTQTGLVGCASIDAYESGDIKRHELTRVEKEADRIRHFDACDANTEPVFLTYRADARIDGLIGDFARARAPVCDFVGADGVGHALWVVDDESVTAALVRAFADLEALYIADGHHRSASAYRVGRMRRSAHPGFDGGEAFNFFMAVAFPDKELRIFDYNRVVRDLAGLSVSDFLSEVGARFTVEARGTVSYAPQEKHCFGMFLANAWYALRARENRIPKGDVIGALDVSILQNALLDPVLGVKEPRTDSRIDFVGGIRGLAELERRVRSDMAVAFSLCPVSVAELLAVADSGLILPPKSTWFEPKLGSGLFVHMLS